MKKQKGDTNLCAAGALAGLALLFALAAPHAMNAERDRQRMQLEHIMGVATPLLVADKPA